MRMTRRGTDGRRTRYRGRSKRVTGRSLTSPGSPTMCEIKLRTSPNPLDGTMPGTYSFKLRQVSMSQHLPDRVGLTTVEPVVVLVITIRVLF